MTTEGHGSCKRIDRNGAQSLYQNPVFCAKTLYCVPARYYVLVLYRHLATGPALAALLAIEPRLSGIRFQEPATTYCPVKRH